MAMVLVFVAVVVVLGPGRVIAGAEYPFGVGPWGSTGRYCHDIDGMTKFAHAWKRSDHIGLSSSQKVTWLAFEKTLTKSGPYVPRADFTAWYRRTGNVAKRMRGETKLINTWWNQNCTEALMEAPASAARVWSGVRSPATFTHYPKNILHLQDFVKVLN